MKKIFLLLLTFSLFFLTSCGSKKPVRQEPAPEQTVPPEAPVEQPSVPAAETPAPAIEQPVQQPAAPAPVAPAPEEKLPAPVPEVPVQAPATPAPVVPVPVPATPAPVQETPAPEPEAPAPEAAQPVPVEKTDAEYLRSVNNIEVTKQTFAEDKTEIMKIIGRLADIMAAEDYDAWVKYIDIESVKYWSNPQNLRKASKMLPVKGLYMNNLHDYFTYIFVPSRRGRQVDEIRYISKNNVKAVEVSENTDIVYYYFVKIDGEWFVRIPPL